jgi:hypothetical protein
MKSITVMGIEYTIEFITSEELLEIIYQEKDEALQKIILEFIGEKAERFAGLCNSSNCKIYVNKSMKYEKARKTLIHEIVEAIGNEIDLDVEHSVIQAITNALFTSGIINVDKLMEKYEDG